MLTPLGGEPMTLVFAGYFPKQIAVPADFGAPHLKDMCSVSEHIAKGPADWISKWRHNENWLFSTPELARSVLEPSTASNFSILAFRILPTHFDGGVERASQRAIPAPEGVGPCPELPPPPPQFKSLGFDVVSCSTGNSFECSPLSCNGAWQDFETNEHCLVNTLERAIELAVIFSKGDGWEPGPYYVLEVLGEFA